MQTTDTKLLYRQATKDDLKQAATVIANSFADYEFYRALKNGFKNHDKYLKTLAKMQLVFLKSLYKFQPILLAELDSKILGVAILERPDKKVPGMASYLRCGGLGLVFRLPLRRLNLFLSQLEPAVKACMQLKKDNPDKVVWFLEAFCVAKGYQGQNIGTQFFNDGVENFAKQNGCNILTLNTSTEQNGNFYTKCGCTLFDTGEIMADKQPLLNLSFKKEL